uniref:Uncharacterized protein n=1 Tax=candidate division WOR-3 bacterium TaxID=2052148 RepID=A0A7C2P0J5_UNCW3
MYVRGVTLGYYIQDPKKLFELLIDIREFSNLWLMVRRGEVSEPEKKRLGELVEKLCEELEVLPFRGRLVKHLLVRRPKLLPKWAAGIPEAVNKILALFKEYLSYICDQAVWQNISQDPTKLDDYVKDMRTAKKGVEQTNGLMFEIIARRWLREVVNGHWINAQNLVVPIRPKMPWHSIEIDAFSLTRVDNQYRAAIAEVKWRFHISPDKGIIDPKSTRPLRDIVADRLEKLTEHFNEWLRIHLNYIEVALISAHPVNDKDKHAYALSEALSYKGIKCQNVKVYDIEDIYESVKSSDHPLKEVIAYLRNRYVSSY